MNPTAFTENGEGGQGVKKVAVFPCITSELRAQSSCAKVLGSAVSFFSLEAYLQMCPYIFLFYLVLKKLRKLRKIQTLWFILLFLSIKSTIFNCSHTYIAHNINNPLINKTLCQYVTDTEYILRFYTVYHISTFERLSKKRNIMINFCNSYDIKCSSHLHMN